MRFERHKKSMFFRGRQGRETPTSDEPAADSGPVGSAPAQEPVRTASSSTDLGDPTHRLLAALGRFQRQMARAREGLPQQEWSDECMAQLITATEIAVEQSWREVHQILTETARILSSYESQGRADECLAFLGDSYEILCNLVGDLITGSLRPTVIERWNERHAQALEEMRGAGVPLIDGEEPAGPVETDNLALAPAEAGTYDESVPELAPEEDIEPEVESESITGPEEPLAAAPEPEESPATEASPEAQDVAPQFSWQEEEDSANALSEDARMPDAEASDDPDAEEDDETPGEPDLDEDEQAADANIGDEDAVAAVLEDWENAPEDAEEPWQSDEAAPGDSEERLDELNRAVEELIEDLSSGPYPVDEDAAQEALEQLEEEGLFAQEGPELKDREESPAEGETPEPQPPEGLPQAAEADGPENEADAFIGETEETEETDEIEAADEVEVEVLAARDEAENMEPKGEAALPANAGPQPAETPSGAQPVHGSLTASGHLPGDVAELLDGFCEEVAGLSSGDSDDIHSVVARLQSTLEALENRATALAKEGAVLPCLAMGRLVRLIADHEAVPDDRFYSLAYDFAGLYNEAGGRSNEPGIQRWLAECDRLLVSWASGRRSGQPAVPVAGEPKQESPVASPPAQEMTAPAPQTPAPQEPAPSVREAAPTAGKFADMADRSGLDTESLLETARKAMIEGNTANAKLLAMQAAAQIAFQQAREAEKAVERAEQRLKQGIGDCEEAAAAAKQREQEVRDAQAAVSMSEGEVVRTASKTRESANELEHVEAMIGEIDEQIANLQRQRAEAEGRRKETETRLASAESEEARTKEELERRKDEEMRARVAQEEAIQHARSMMERRGRLAEAMEEARSYLLTQRDSLADIEDTISQVCSAPQAKGLPQDELPFQ